MIDGICYHSVTKHVLDKPHEISESSFSFPPNPQPNQHVKFIITGLIASLFLVSCGTMDAVKSTTASATKSVRQFSLSDLRLAKIDVVEVREKDLKEMPSGKDRALAFDRERKRSFWSFLGGDFKEPSLPAIDDGEIDGSLLPPKPL